MTQAKIFCQAMSLPSVVASAELSTEVAANYEKRFVRFNTGKDGIPVNAKGFRFPDGSACYFGKNDTLTLPAKFA